MRRIGAVLLAVLIAGCGSAPKKGGYYKDDGPGERAPASVPDAQPRAEPLHRFANRPYDAFGKHYVPLTRLQPFRQRGIASW